jgi:hypothetical protein
MKRPIFLEKVGGLHARTSLMFLVEEVESNSSLFIFQVYG